MLKDFKGFGHCYRVCLCGYYSVSHLFYPFLAVSMFKGHIIPLLPVPYVGRIWCLAAIGVRARARVCGTKRTRHFYLSVKLKLHVLNIFRSSPSLVPPVSDVDR